MFTSITTLIVDTIASLLAGVLLLRFWMQMIRVRPPHAMGQFIFQLTDWLVLPLRKIFPGIGGYDWASLIGAIAVAVLAVVIELALSGVLDAQVIALTTVARLCNWILYGFMGMILIGAIFSWVNPHAPSAPFIASLSEPLLRPVRRVMPLIGNIDLSPLVVLLLLQIALMLVRTVLASAF